MTVYSINEVIGALNGGLTSSPLAAALLSKRKTAPGQLAPMILSTDGGHVDCRAFLSASSIDLLNNESPDDASRYPLRIEDGTYFSEVTGIDGFDACYQKNVEASIERLRLRSIAGELDFSDLLSVGSSIQEIDAELARSRIGKPLDSLHSFVGADPVHPYAKITLCRTTLPIRLGPKIVRFFFEKFLVAYSFLDANGKRLSTRTPIHSHPLNFETVYFASFGPRSRVVEQEFDLVDSATGMPLSMMSDKSERLLTGLRALPADSSVICDSAIPLRALQPFESERWLQANPQHARWADGLYRPHQVQVIDDPSVDTRYFAIDNYFGPSGRVIVYKEDGTTEMWNHSEWRPTPE